MKKEKIFPISLNSKPRQELETKIDPNESIAGRLIGRSKPQPSRDERRGSPFSNGPSRMASATDACIPNEWPTSRDFQLN
jgi:hypothetical protein